MEDEKRRDQKASSIGSIRRVVVAIGCVVDKLECCLLVVVDGLPFFLAIRRVEICLLYYYIIVMAYIVMAHCLVLLAIRRVEICMPHPASPTQHFPSTVTVTM